MSAEPMPTSDECDVEVSRFSRHAIRRSVERFHELLPHWRHRGCWRPLRRNAAAHELGMRQGAEYSNAVVKRMQGVELSDDFTGSLR
jgi:hypothetical protein